MSEPGGQAWAATLVMVDVAAQDPLCAAMPTKSDEHAYLTTMCAAFVKRMGKAKAVLKVDPELALIVGGQDCGESKCRLNSTQGRDSSKIQLSEYWCSWASTRRSGRSDSMLASRVGRTSLVGSDTGETCWMVP